MAIINFDNVRFSYDGQANALNGLSLAIEPGSFVCVLGGNGSGKSTFAKHINALLVPDGGTVRVLGLDSSDLGNAFAIRSNAGMVFQNPDDQIVASVVENDVAFGPENMGVEPAELRQRVDEALAQVGLQGFGEKQTEALSGGQKQRVAVAGALAMRPQILVLDEASAMLDPRGRKGLLRVCRELNESGMTIVLITHFMDEANHADRVVVLDEGSVALDASPEQAFAQTELLERLALDVPFAVKLSSRLRDLNVNVRPRVDEEGLFDELAALLGTEELADSAGFGKSQCPTDAGPQADEPAERCETERADDAGAPEKAAPEAPAAVEFEHVYFAYEPASQDRRRKRTGSSDRRQADWGRSPDEHWAVQDLSFRIRQGEFFGIAGHTGSGKSTLIQLANGLLKPTEGRVKVAGWALSSKKDAAAARRDVGVVFQYPEHQLFAATVFDDVAFGPRNLGLAAEEVERNVRGAMELVHLDLDDLRDRSPFSLSGGQQRRVAFAGVLAMKPKVLMLDEPVAGLDPRAKRRFLDLLSELHDQQGLTVAVVSHNMDDLAQLCDRILVLNEGRLFDLGAPSRIFADEARLTAVGLGVPCGVRMARRLEAAGISLPIGPLPSVDELALAIAGQLSATQKG